MIPAVLMTVYLSWSVSLDAAHDPPRRFRFQMASPNLTQTRPPEPFPIWTALDLIDTSGCAITTSQRTGARRMDCSRIAPDLSKLYRLQSENDAGVSAWTQETRLVCVSNGGTGCDCARRPSPPGCIP